MPKNNSRSNKNSENVYTKESSKKGLAGFFEMLLRRFRTVSFVLALSPLYILGILAMGLSATPGVYLVSKVFAATADWTPLLKYPVLSTGIVCGYFLYGFTLIFIIPLFNFLMPFRIKPFRGNYFSLESVPWYFHNAFLYIVRYTFLDFITPTPLNILFFKMMGMKIGKGVHINTSNISDAGLIEIGDHVTIGGSAHILAHYGQKGYLVLSRVKIGDGVNIGLKATILGNVEIGDKAIIAPHEVIFPKTRIVPGRRPVTPSENGMVKIAEQQSS